MRLLLFAPRPPSAADQICGVANTTVWLVGYPGRTTSTRGVTGVQCMLLARHELDWSRIRNDKSRSLSDFPAASALARNDPTLLAKSDPAPPAAGVPNSR